MEKIVLITGAAGGIGRACVDLFYTRGWRVIATDRQEASGFSKKIIFQHMDVSDPESIKILFDELASWTDRLDAIVNNAAIQICKPIIQMEVEEWDDTMASNLRSIFLTSRYGYPYLKAVKGAIVNVSSVHAIATSRDISAYAASKGGVVALTRALALEFAQDGIRVNVILPGAVDTHMLRSGLNRSHVSGASVDERLLNLAQRTVMGRIGEPEEIAKSIFFLADSDQSSFMTGQMLIIDGGAIARLSTE
ncbi:MAG: short-chain dehydrogenase [Chloroflexi bacterium RBG_16_48_8]|nr:MAG: short-chain dehydrogenase [Chloroflexi bacterium RBG_16_48_8]